MTNMITSSRSASIMPLGHCARFSLRLRPENKTAAETALGFALPGRIGLRSQAGGRSAACLGPDEWVIHAPESDRDTLTAAFNAVAAHIPLALCDISDRELSFQLKGPRVLELLATGCPLDLAKMPVGSARRTIFDTVQMVLVREADDQFRMEMWRSFVPHVLALLARAQRELDSGF